MRNIPFNGIGLAKLNILIGIMPISTFKVYIRENYPGILYPVL